jgi:hypothetical protein
MLTTCHRARSVCAPCNCCRYTDWMLPDRLPVAAAARSEEPHLPLTSPALLLLPQNPVQQALVPTSLLPLLALEDCACSRSAACLNGDDCMLSLPPRVAQAAVVPPSAASAAASGCCCSEPAAGSRCPVSQPSASVTLPSAPPLLPPAAVATRAPLASPHAAACGLPGTAVAVADAALQDRTGTMGCRPSLPQLPLSLPPLPLPSLPPPPRLSLPSLPLPALPALLGRAPLPRPADARSRATSRCSRMSVTRTSSVQDGRRRGSCRGHSHMLQSIVRFADCSSC